MSESSKKFGFERKDVNLKPIGKFTFGLFIFMIVVLFAMRGLFGVFYRHQLRQEPPSPPMAQPDAIPPEPRLEAYEGEVVDRVRAYEQPLLETYGWIDRPNGYVRIPVERAMELLATREGATSP